MKTLFGVILIFLSVVLGLYVGGWVLFVGGIIDILEAVRDFFAIEGHVLEVMKIVWGIVKMCIASIVGWLVWLILFIPGLTMLK